MLTKFCLLSLAFVRSRQMHWTFTVIVRFKTTRTARVAVIFVARHVTAVFVHAQHAIDAKYVFTLTHCDWHKLT